MSIKETKTRTMITIEKDMKLTLEQMAKNDGRSFNNMLIKILSDYIDSHK